MITYPYIKLDANEYEQLLFQIFDLGKDKIDFGLQYDNVTRPPGGSDCGIDISLLNDGKYVGVIQCKKYDTLLARPLVAKEVIKFLACSIVQDIKYDLDNFIYYFATTNGFNKKADRLLNTFNTEIINQIEIEDWFNEILIAPSLKVIDNQANRDLIKRKLKKITIKRIVPDNLDIYLIKLPDIIELFFPVRKVVIYDEIPEHFYSIDVIYNRLRTMFENSLIFFSENEKQGINLIINSLHKDKFSLITGKPAYGKTVFSIHIADILQKYSGFTAYYYDFANGIVSLRNDIRKNLKNKVLFIIDNIHLDITNALNIYYEFASRSKHSCFLFISRELSDISKKELDVFSEYNRFTITEEDVDEKTGLIIQNYLPSSSDYHEFLKTNSFFDKNLIILKLFIDLIKKGKTISDNIEKELLNYVFYNYLKDFSRDNLELVIQLLAVNTFEISLKNSTSNHDVINILENNGFLIKSGDTYSFYHNSFVNIALKAFAHSFNIELNEMFFIDKIAKYISCFSKYPENLHQIFFNLYKKRMQTVVSELENKKTVRDKILDYYSTHKIGIQYNLFDTKYYEIEDIKEKGLFDTYSNVDLFVKTEHQRCAERNRYYYYDDDFGLFDEMESEIEEQIKIELLDKLFEDMPNHSYLDCEFEIEEVYLNVKSAELDEDNKTIDYEVIVEAVYTEDPKTMENSYRDHEEKEWVQYENTISRVTANFNIEIHFDISEEMDEVINFELDWSSYDDGNIKFKDTILNEYND